MSLIIRPLVAVDTLRVGELVRAFCEYHRACDPIERVRYALSQDVTVEELVRTGPEAYVVFMLYSPWDDGRLEEAIQRYAVRENTRWFLAEAETGVEGFALAWVRHDPSWMAPRRVGWLDSAFVSPAARGQGIGRALNDAVLTWMSEMGVEEVQLSALACNESAISAWQAMGYRPYFQVLTRPIGGHHG